MAQQILREAEASEDARQVICFAYGQFYDPETGQVFLPTPETFVNRAYEALRPRSDAEQFAAAAVRIYNLLQSLEDGELVGVAENLACG